MLNQRLHIAASYTSQNGRTPRPATAQASRPSSAIKSGSRRDSGAAARLGKAEDWGITAVRAHTIFRLSLHECQPDRKRNELKHTLSECGSRPWSRGDGGAGARRCLLRGVPLRVHAVLRCYIEEHQTETSTKPLRWYTRSCVTRDEGGGPQVVAREGRKSRTLRDHAGSPFGRL